jgi:hypothetical protein
MRKWLAVLCLLAAPANAQELAFETVISDASAMAGLWRISRPDFISIEGNAAPRLGPLRESFCRIDVQKEVLMHCSGLDAATVTAEGEQVLVSWGPPAARLVIVGELQNPNQLLGHFRFTLSGAVHENRTVSEAVRITPEPGAPDKGGKEALLRRILTNGFAGVRRDDAVSRWPEPPRLGTVTALTYVGEENAEARSGTVSAYLVTFANGERICKLSQRGDGALDGFACV